MSEKSGISRRGIMGVLAAASAGKLTGVGAARDGTVEAGSAGALQTDDVLADYANRAGRIDTPNLEEAFDDWGDGDITSEELEAVIEAWNQGDRVVEKTVVEWSDSITEDTVWETNPDGYDPGDDDTVIYKIMNPIAVNATLTIEAGVAVEFTQGSEMDVDDGTLVAEGTESETILFTSTRAQRGWWNGVYVRNTDLDNVMQHVIVEYGGGDNACLDLASQFSSDEGLIEVSNCTFRRSGGYGLYLSDGGELAGGSGENTYTLNRTGAVEARTENFYTLSGDSTYTDNDDDWVRVTNAGAELTGDGPDEDQVTIDVLDVPYRMDNGRHTFDDLELVIEEGSTFEFTQDAYPRFQSGTRMIVVGTEDDPITFTGTDDQRGWWNGLEVETQDSESVLEHVVVEYGGNDLPANVTLGDRLSSSEADIEIRNCTFRHADGFGLYAADDVDLDEEENTYTENADGAARVRTELVHMLSDTSTFQGNDNDYVLVNEGKTLSGDGPDEDSVTWESIDVPYRVDGDDHVINDITLTVDPGATFEFTEGSRMGFRSGCRMDISGFDEDAENEEDMVDPITFTGTKEERGWWDGLEIETRDGESILDRVVVEYAGNDLPGNITLADRLSSSECELEIDACTFRHADGYGLYAADDVEMTMGSGNTFTDNDVPARIRAENIHMLERSTFEGNDNDYILVDEGSTVNDNWSDQTWRSHDVPYRMDGEIVVDDIEIQVDVGATFEFTEGSRIGFRGDSTIIMEGNDNESDRITFTGVEEERGWWDGIEYESVSQRSRFEHVVIEYAGEDLPANLTLADRLSSSEAVLEMENCTLRESKGYGLYGSDDVDLTESDNTYTSNTEGPVRLRGESVHGLSGSSSYGGNDTDYVEVTSTTLNDSDVPPGENWIVWDALDVPYLLSGDLHADATLELEAGTEVHAAENVVIELDSGAGIFQGESDDQIVFKQNDIGQGFDGWWYGILVDSDSAQNVMEHVVVQGGGGNTDNEPDGNVHVTDDGQLNMTDSELRNSGNYGVYVESGGAANSDICEANTFADNVGGECYVE